VKLKNKGAGRCYMLFAMRQLMALLALVLASFLPAGAQTAPAAPAAVDPLAPLDFLLGTWSAKTDGSAGSAGAAASGVYTFSRDLAGHALARTGSLDSCKGPQSFDCSHHDQLTVFSDPNALAVHHASLLALYLDSEGHVIYYTVSTPDQHTAIFLSQAIPSAPRFRLTYHLEGAGAKAVMSGKFQMAAPGSEDFHSYLEWSGTKQ
jgi:hypothetical protein